MIRCPFTVASVLSLTLLMACETLSPSDAGAENKADNNNTAETAQALPFDSTCTLKIDSAGDIDYFRFTLDTPSVNFIMFTGIPAALSLSVLFEDREGTRLKSYHVGEATYCFKAGPGEYYLRVSGGWNQQSDQAFTVYLRGDTLDRYEVNDTTSTAADAVIGAVYRAGFFPENEIDFYKLTLAEPHIIRVVVDSISSQVSPYITRYDSEGTRLYYRSYQKGVQCIEHGLSAQAGVHYISLNAGYNQKSYTQPYYIQFLADTTDPTEWNDDTAHAYTLAFGDTVYGAIYPETDVDYYRFSLAQDDTVLIAVDSVSSKTNLTVHLLDNEATQIKYEYEYAGKSISLRRFLSTGEYFIWIEDEFHDGISGRRHRISVNLN